MTNTMDAAWEDAGRLRALEFLREMRQDSCGSAEEAVLSLCYDSLQARLREDVTKEELAPLEEQFSYTAALLAFRQLLETEEAASPGEIRAGEMSLRSGRDSSALGALIRESEGALAKVLRDDGFFFLCLGEEKQEEKA